MMAGSPSAPSVDDVRGLLAASFPDAVGMAACRVAGPRYASPNSRIFYAECPDFDVPLAVKFCRDADDARLQFEALEGIAAALSEDADFNVPRPVALIGDDRVVVIEWIDGRSIDADLTNWRLSPRRTAAALRRAGAWLRHFHAAAAEGEAPLDTAAALDRLADVLAECTPDTPGIACAERAAALLRSAAATVARTPVPVSWMHSDFKPANIMLAGPRTVGIDMRRQHRDAVVRDQAYFLAHLDLACCDPRGLRFWPARQRLAAAFLDGYGWTEGAYPAAPLLWTQLHTMVRIWAGFSASRRGRLRKFYLRRCCEALIGSLSRRLEALL